MSPHFTEKELACPCCKRCKMDTYLLEVLETIRDECGFPLRVTSGFRCEKHNQELKGSSPKSQHFLGKAVDIDTSRLSAEMKYKLAEAPLVFGIRGFGVYDRFFHLDVRDGEPSFWVGKGAS